MTKKAKACKQLSSGIKTLRRMQTVCQCIRLRDYEAQLCFVCLYCQGLKTESCKISWLQIKITDDLSCAKTMFCLQTFLNYYETNLVNVL